MSRRQLPLLTAGAGAVAVLVDVGAALDLVGLVAIAAGGLLAAPMASQPAAIASWWSVLAAGAALVLIGVPLSLLVGGVGDLVSAAGAVAVVIAVALALPTGEAAG